MREQRGDDDLAETIGDVRGEVTPRVPIRQVRCRCRSGRLVEVLESELLRPLRCELGIGVERLLELRVPRELPRETVEFGPRVDSSEEVEEIQPVQLVVEVVLECVTELVDELDRLDQSSDGTAESFRAFPLSPLK